MAESKQNQWDNFFFFYHDSAPKGTLTSDSCTRLTIQIPMLSNCRGCPQINLISHPYPRLAVLSGMHLEPGLKKKKKKRAFSRWKKFPKTTNTFLSIFRHVHITPIIRHLHWWPVRARISCKTAGLCFNAIISSTPAYLSDLLHLYSPSRSLRPNADTRLRKIPLYMCKTKSDRAFSYFGSSVWNSLPLHITIATKTIHTFKSALKTYLFNLQESD